MSFIIVLSFPTYFIFNLDNVVVLSFERRHQSSQIFMDVFNENKKFVSLSFLSILVLSFPKSVVLSFYQIVVFSIVPSNFSVIVSKSVS